MVIGRSIPIHLYDATAALISAMSLGRSTRAISARSSKSEPVQAISARRIDGKPAGSAGISGPALAVRPWLEGPATGAIAAAMTGPEHTADMLTLAVLCSALLLDAAQGLALGSHCCL